MEELKTVGTFWLGGCSGCHMSFLDLDERLMELSRRARIVASPFSSVKTITENMDIALVEGAVSMEEHVPQLLQIRERAHTLVSFGDCAVSGNLTAMRNSFSTASVMQRAFGTAIPLQTTEHHLPVLRDEVVPIHACVAVDLFIPGCPPAPDLIWHVLTELLAGRKPKLNSVDLRNG